MKSRQMEYLLFTEDNQFGLIIKKNGLDIAQLQGIDDRKIRISPKGFPVEDLSKTFEMHIEDNKSQTIYDVAKSYIDNREADISNEIHEIKKCFRRIERSLNCIKNADCIIEKSSGS